jgi:hypothetical protein
MRGNKPGISKELENSIDLPRRDVYNIPYEFPAKQEEERGRVVRHRQCALRRLQKYERKWRMNDGKQFMGRQI